jgi:hypothetical protein
MPTLKNDVLLASKRPMFLMPQFSPGKPQSNSTPAIDLNNTTAKKLDFDGTECQLNFHRL